MTTLTHAIMVPDVPGRLVHLHTQLGEPAGQVRNRCCLLQNAQGDVVNKTWTDQVLPHL